jgi:hypothetical protein
MKKFTYLVVAVALVALGWLIGRRTTGDAHVASKADQSSIASDVLKAQMFNSAYTEAAYSETVIEQLDSGRIEDAKQMLRTHQDSCIFALDSTLDPTPISSEDMIALRDLNASIQSSHGSKLEVADKILARIARHRADHPWTYKGDLPHSSDPEIEAKLASILKRASESQR